MAEEFKNQQLLENAIEHYGHKAQAGQAMEECGELITAVHKYFFRENGSAINLASEIADVKIMCEQLSLILEQQGHAGIVDKMVDIKLSRLDFKIKSCIG